MLLTEIKPWQAFVGQAIAPTRFALILIGVRMAFGASRRDIQGSIVGQGLRLSGAGIVVGVIAGSASRG